MRIATCRGAPELRSTSHVIHDNSTLPSLAPIDSEKSPLDISPSVSDVLNSYHGLPNGEGDKRDTAGIRRSDEPWRAWEQLQKVTRPMLRSI
jgi:hypothetical protein